MLFYFWLHFFLRFYFYFFLKFNLLLNLFIFILFFISINLFFWSFFFQILFKFTMAILGHHNGQKPCGFTWRNKSFLNRDIVKYGP